MPVWIAKVQHELMNVGRDSLQFGQTRLVRRHVNAVAGAIKETEHGFRAMIWQLLRSNRGPMDDNDSEIEGLIDEHRQLMTILGQLQRTSGEPGSDLDGLLDQLEAALTHHTEREEAGLFHALHKVDVRPEYMDLFEHDHGHLVELIATARGDRHSVDGLVKIFDAHMQA